MSLTSRRLTLTHYIFFGMIVGVLLGFLFPDSARAEHRGWAASDLKILSDLFIRGICTLRPGVPGLSERIRVVSILGRFLEHARVYHFANGGADEYYIGSADWRPRNLRHRVEVMAPVFDAAARRRLDSLLTKELAEPGSWLLQSDGRYDRS